MSQSTHALLSVLLVLVLAFPANAQARPRAYDSVTQDASPDTAWPAALRALAIESHGSTMNGVLYTAAGPGPHPTVVILHGYPGNEQNLDLAHAIRRAGMNAVAFHYRGSWGSGGFFSPSNALEDVEAVVAYLRSPEHTARYRIDPNRIVLVGHSLGSWLAIMASAGDSRLPAVAALAVTNMGALGRAAGADPRLREAVAASIRSSAREDSGPIRVSSGYAAVDTMVAYAADWDLTARAPELANRHVLLVGATRDQEARLDLNHVPVREELGRAGADVRELILDTDHSFSGVRIALATTLIGWLDEVCGGSR